MKRKHNILFLISAIGLVMWSTFLSVGITFGRYSTQISGDVGYRAERLPYLYMDEVSGLDHLEFTSSEWQAIGGEQRLSFTLANGNRGEQSPPGRDIPFRVYVFVPDEAGENLGTLSFTLQVGDDLTTFSSEVDYLSTQTPQYAEHEQSGWVYSFYETVGQAGVKSEVVRTLKGGVNSELAVTVTVQNTGIDCSAFEIYVDRMK